MDHDLELLQKVAAVGDFFDAALFKDNLPDWRVAQDFGMLLMRLSHDDLLTHLLLARAARHLGEADLAAAELQRCRSLVGDSKATSGGEDPLLRTLDVEERLARPDTT